MVGLCDNARLQLQQKWSSSLKKYGCKFFLVVTAFDCILYKYGKLRAYVHEGKSPWWQMSVVANVLRADVLGAVVRVADILWANVRWGQMSVVADVLGADVLGEVVQVVSYRFA